jgi:hypothetical protein
MSRIADLLERDFSSSIEETVRVNDEDPDTVYSELTEYVVTGRIRAEYERLFSAMAAAPKSPNEGGGVWISGFFGCGKSSFAKNLGYVLANRGVRNTTASAPFLKQVESELVAEYVQFLNRLVPLSEKLFATAVPLGAAIAAIVAICYDGVTPSRVWMENYQPDCTQISKAKSSFVVEEESIRVMVGGSSADVRSERMVRVTQ